MSSRMFSELVRRSRRVSRDEFAVNFGGIADDVVEMLNSDQAYQAIQEARESYGGSVRLPCYQTVNLGCVRLNLAYSVRQENWRTAKLLL